MPAIDLSRFATNFRKNYDSVRMQQGRVLTDDDFNESERLDQEDERRTRVHVVGGAGSPDDGFLISNPTLSAGRANFAIKNGTMYLGGLRLEMHEPESYTGQKDWLRVDPIPLPGAGTRIDLVYLEAWQQSVSAVEDSELFEVALSGPDTSTRIRNMRRVRVAANVGTADCESAWNALVATWGNLGNLTSEMELVPEVTLRVGFDPPSAPNDPCSPPVLGGFVGPENQAIRVQLVDATHFTWGYDNAAPIYRVQVSANVNGQRRVITMLTEPKDQAHWPLTGQVIELLPWSTVLPNREKVAELSGFLAKVDGSYNPDTGQLSISTSVPAGFGEEWKNRPDAADLQPPEYLYFRVWNRGSDTLSIPAISFTPGVAVSLAGTGLNVTIAGAHRRANDFWVIAARPDSPEEAVPWELKAGRRPHGYRKFYAPLAMLRWSTANNVTTGQVVKDCRKPFPPLTDIAASDVKFDGSVCAFGPNVTTVQQAIDALCASQEDCCTLIVRPGANWMDVFNTIPAAGAHICFQPGIYELSKKVEVTGKGAIVISGVGDAGKIVALNDECALRFVNCGSISIRDLSAEGRVAQIGSGRSNDGILGVISIKNATDVLVENCRLTSANGPHRTTACLSIHSASHASVRANRFVAGVQQVGVLFSNVASVRAEGNIITGRSRTVASDLSLLNDLQFLAAVRTRLVTNLFVGDPLGQVLSFNVSTIVGGQQVTFLAPQTHIAQWVNLLQQNPLPGNPSINNIEDHVLGLATRILIQNPFPAFSGVRSAILNNVTTSGQGITVGGTTGESIVIQDNRISGVIQGIHIGLSAPNPNISVAERVVILNNQIAVMLGVGSTRGRHGIYVGNVTSLSIRGNRLTLVRPAGAQDMQIDGIRVFGRLGRSIIIRENHLVGFNIGIRFELRGALPPTPMWLVNDNLAEGSSLVVSAPNVANKANNFG